ncbi:MAG: hypothetical protein GF417_14245 [Candidatus Latescibacteria bacterium]|nr:hypothetical protein [bacterium]MBD3425592.1 hypothetical protein [Candidatus Latescibacterota bacterium]
MNFNGTENFSFSDDIIRFRPAIPPSGQIRCPTPPPGVREDITTLAYSLEVIASLEKPLINNSSISLWAGAGSIWNSSNSERAWGNEIALEVRSYTSAFLYGNSSTGLNAGAYLGVGYFNSTDSGDYWVLAPGIKITGCINIPDTPMIIEPYLSVSLPYTEEGRDKAGWEFRDEPLLTFGLRMVFRKLY